MVREFNGSEFMTYDGVFLYTGEPPLIIDLNRERECKLTLSSHDELDKLISLLKDDSRESVVSEEQKERFLIRREDYIASKKMNVPFLKLFGEYVSSKLLDNETHSLKMYHREDVLPPERQFEDEEITLSHVYRRAHPALYGMSYGERFAEVCHNKGYLFPNSRIMEVGGGIGYFGEAFLSYLKKELSSIYHTIDYTFFDLSPLLLDSQKKVNKLHQRLVHFIEGDIETYDFGNLKYDLIISNEMIADLEVVKLKKRYFHSQETPPEHLKEIVSFSKKCGLDFDDSFETFLVNAGAFRFLKRMKEILTKQGKAIIVEYGDFNLYPSASVLKRHTEFSIHFGHLEKVAKALGFNVEISNMMDFLGFRGDVKVIDFLSFVALREHLLPFFGKNLQHFAYTEALLKEEIGEQFYNNIFGLRFVEIREGQGVVNPQDFTVLIITNP